jgi:ferredoxin
MKLRIDAERCSGHGRCYDLAPELFDDDEFGHGKVRVDVVPAEQLAQAQIAVDCCPERAISLVDD